MVSRKLPYSIFLIALSVLLNACTGSQYDSGLPGEKSTEGILQGKAAQTQDLGFRSVVLLVTAEDEICTGVLVAPNVALTAAHCVEDFSSDPNTFHNEEGAALGTLGFAAAPLETRKITRFIKHEKFAGEKWIEIQKQFYMPRYAYDLALVYFEGSLPVETEIAVMQSIMIQDIVKRKFQVYGYGLKTTDDKELETRDSELELGAETFIREKAQLHTVSIDALYDEKLEYGFMIDQRGKPGICHGDSGGPAFIEKNGKTYLVGINSHRTGLFRDLEGQKPKEKISHICQYYSVINRVTYFQNWIKENVTKITQSDCSSLPFFRARAAQLFGFKEAGLQIQAGPPSEGKIQYSISGNLALKDGTGSAKLTTDLSCRLPIELGSLRKASSHELNNSLLKELAIELRNELPGRTILFQDRSGSATSAGIPLLAKTLEFNREVLDDESISETKTKLGSDLTLKISENPDGIDLLEEIGISKLSLRKKISELANQSTRIYYFEYSLEDEGVFRQELWLADIALGEYVIVRKQERTR